MTEEPHVTRTGDRVTLSGLTFTDARAMLLSAIDASIRGHDELEYELSTHPRGAESIRRDIAANVAYRERLEALHRKLADLAE